MKREKEKIAETGDAVRRSSASCKMHNSTVKSISENEQKDKHFLKTIDGETLMTQPLQPMNFIVDTLLSQGLHILAGSPKVGKSWLALWLAVTVAKGEQVWGMRTKSGTTLYLCLEDSQLRIQNRLFTITEDAPHNVHFCTECDLLGKGLEQQLEAFIEGHPDTVLVIIDTLQMIRGTSYDSTYANDYRDLSVLKHFADRHGIAMLLIHHLRKEHADDVFNRISGTTAISGAVDSSFTLIGNKRGSGGAKLHCIGRDIEYRELTLERNGENIWQVISDSYEQPLLLEERIVFLLSEFLKERREFIGTPTELAARIDPDGAEGITAKTVSRKILQSLDTLGHLGIVAAVRRSNGKRLIELHRADSDDTTGGKHIVPSDPVTPTKPSCAAFPGTAECSSSGDKEPPQGDCSEFQIQGCGRSANSSLSGGQAERPSDFVGLDAAGEPAMRAEARTHFLTEVSHEPEKG